MIFSAKIYCNYNMLNNVRWKFTGWFAVKGGSLQDGFALKGGSLQDGLPLKVEIYV